jgi:hypothetical protein
MSDPGSRGMCCLGRISLSPERRSSSWFDPKWDDRSPLALSRSAPRGRRSAPMVPEHRARDILVQGGPRIDWPAEAARSGAELAFPPPKG